MRAADQFAALFELSFLRVLRVHCGSRFTPGSRT
jgi:hypothetical protein